MYTDVSMYNDWIVEEINYINENIDLDVPQSTTTDAMLSENTTVPYYDEGVGAANSSINITLKIYLFIVTQLFYYLINYI